MSIFAQKQACCIFASSEILLTGEGGIRIHMRPFQKLPFVGMEEDPFAAAREGPFLTSLQLGNFLFDAE